VCRGFLRPSEPRVGVADANAPDRRSAHLRLLGLDGGSDKLGVTPLSLEQRSNFGVESPGFFSLFRLISRFRTQQWPHHSQTRDLVAGFLHEIFPAGRFR
jgi:hypothetical protein